MIRILFENRPIDRRKALSLAALLVLFLLAVWAGSLYLPGGFDWEAFRRGSLLLIQGKSPYQEGVYNPPWALIPSILLLPFHENVGRSLWFFLSLASFAFVAFRLGGSKVATIAFLLSPPVIECLLHGNNDWLVLIGVILPPQVGLFFLAIKPQVGFGLAIYWVYEAFRRGGLREVVRLIAPVTAAFVLSFLVYGFWPAYYRVTYDFSMSWNASLWPISIPVGVLLLVHSLRSKKPGFAVAASPCLSPYVIFHSWSGALVMLARYPVEMVAAVIGLWILVGIRAIGL